MVTWRYEKYFFNKRREISFPVLFHYINTNEIPNHFTLIVFCCERHNYVAIAMVIFHM